MWSRRKFKTGTVVVGIAVTAVGTLLSSCKKVSNADSVKMDNVQVDVGMSGLTLLPAGEPVDLVGVKIIGELSEEELGEVAAVLGRVLPRSSRVVYLRYARQDDNGELEFRAGLERGQLILGRKLKGTWTLHLGTYSH